MIVRDALRVRARYICVAFDGPKVFRYKVYPQYKEGRKGIVGTNADAENAPPSGDVYDFLPHIYTLFQKLGILFFQPRIHEADDVLASIVDRYAGTYRIVCGTCDKDAYQYLQPGVRLFDSSHKNKVTKKSEPRYITQEDAERRKGVACSQMVDYQTLIGDKGDSIPPIKGYGPETAKKVLEKFGNLNNWFKESTGDQRVFIRAQMENLRRNRKLVQLLTDCLPPNELEEWKIHKVKPDMNLPRIFHDYHAFIFPKTKGLFG
jgi:5'-3' exonuclease